MPQEEEEPPLRFYGLVFSEPFHEPPPNTQPVKLFTFHEKDLENTGSDSLDIANFGGADLIQEEAGATKYPSASIYMPRFPPIFGALAYCPVTRSLILAGGCLFDLPERDAITLRGVWSIKATATPPTWKFCKEMGRAREHALAVPYVDQKIYIFGGDYTPTYPIEPPSLEIYDPSTGDLSGPIPFDKDFRNLSVPIPFDRDFQNSMAYSYFLWKDSSAPHKKPLIMIHLAHFSEVNMSSQLCSYDVQGKGFQMVDSNFPALAFGNMRSLLLPLGRHDTLLIVHGPPLWWIYDMSAKQVKGQVNLVDVEGLRPYAMVKHGFCRYSSDSSALVYLFMDHRQGHETFPQDITCVKFRLKIDREEIVADRVGQVGLHIGENMGFYMVAVPETGDLGSQGWKRKHDEGCS